jgi:hypothetical protein
VETVSADFNSYFIMPAATFREDWAVANGILTPSLRLRYAAIWQQSYTEHGTGYDLDFESRMTHLLDARLQVEYEFAPIDTKTGTLFTSLRLGGEVQYLGQDDVSASLGGDPLVFTAGDGGTSGRGFAGFDLRHLSDDGGRELLASIAAGRTSYGRTDVSASFGWTIRF